MLIEKSIAPPLPTLRPTKPTSSATFPVYHDLEALLAEEEQQPDQQPPATVAHTLAVAAGYAYSDATTVSMMLARMGLRTIIACRWTCPWTRCSSGPPPI